jgi:hypothetical protein
MSLIKLAIQYRFLQKKNIFQPSNSFYTKEKYFHNSLCIKQSSLATRQGSDIRSGYQMVKKQMVDHLITGLKKCPKSDHSNTEQSGIRMPTVHTLKKHCN